MDSFKIGDLSKKCNVSIETIRYYEKIKLMPIPKRKDSRYRIYDENDFARLKFILRAKELGFTLNEIKELLSLKVDSQAKCGDLKQFAETKIEDIKKKVEDLNKIKIHLNALVNQCINEELSIEDCPIVKSLVK